MRTAGYAREFSSLLVMFMRLFDAGLIFASGVYCFYWLEQAKQFPPYDGLMPSNYLTVMWIAILLSLWWFPILNVYRSWRNASLYKEIVQLMGGWLLSLTGLVLFIFFTKSADDFSRHWLGLWFLSAFVTMSMARLLMRLVLRQVRSRGHNLRHIVLVGNEIKCSDIARQINATPWLGLQIVGYFGGAESVKNNTIIRLGALTELLAYLDDHEIDQVWIALPLQEINTIDTLCQSLAQVSVEVLLVPDISGWRLLNHSVTQINGLPIINITTSPMNGNNILVKWLEDKILSLLILIAISPLLLVIAALVRLSSPGPILYRQKRVSWNGKHFNMLKFRSMPVDADSMNGNPVWGQAHAKQPTRLGVFLRKTSLDELPQFFNVFKGDMSIVGPRPERPMFVEEFRYEIDGYMQKHLVKAGITGWAQVNGWRGDTCLKKRVEYDLEYIERWSLWFDLRIIFMTLLGAMSLSKNDT